MENRHGDYITIYVTKNRRSPVLALINRNDWPRKAAFLKMANAGVKIATRPATEQESKMQATSFRHVAIQWESIYAMITCEWQYMGKAWGKKLIQAIRDKKPLVDQCTKQRLAKTKKHEETLEARREAAKQAKQQKRLELNQ